MERIRKEIREKRAQVALYIILAAVLVVGVLIFFFIRGNGGKGENVEEFVTVYDYYRDCIEQQIRLAISIAGTQGGYIIMPDYVPGNEFAPTSSQLNFLGWPVPYWYYVSSGGLVKEQVPTKSKIESEMAEFVEEGIKGCNFEDFYRSGYAISLAEPVVKVTISDLKIDVGVDAAMAVARGNSTGRKVVHRVEVPSKFGKFYNLARRIYDKEKKEAFFENFASDTLYLNAPVDGVELQCGPKIWRTRQVIDELKQALEGNFGAIKFRGGYYTLTDSRNKYYVVDLSSDEQINVLYSRNWPTKIDIMGEGVDEELLSAEAVGTQEGLGVMGFCYVPYHFVYDVSFPAMIQIYNNEELFQFPVVVVIDNNLPRNASFGNSSFRETEAFDLCEFKNQDISVSLYNTNLNPVNGNLSFECFDQKCRMGESENGQFIGRVPGCVNGYIHVRAPGYAEKKVLYSSNKERVSEIVLDREYEVVVNVSVGGRLLDEDEMAFISFVREDGKSTSTALPYSNKLKLSEGSYEINVHVYSNSSITIPGNTKTHCQQVPRPGLGALFGLTKEQCFDINVPETKLDYALIGGGTSNDYMLETELVKGNVRVVVPRFETPRTLEDLQKNFDSFETRRADVAFYSR